MDVMLIWLFLDKVLLLHSDTCMVTSNVYTNCGGKVDCYKICEQPRFLTLTWMASIL